MNVQMVTPPELRECGDCPIRYRAVCSRCEMDELARLSAMKSYKVFQPGDVLQWAGEGMEYVCSIVTGAASLSQTMEDGRRQMVGLLLPSDFVGRPGRETSPFDVTAVAETTVCRFRRRDFEMLIDESPAVSRRLLEMTMDELQAARQWMMVLGRKNAREKVASFLAVLAGRRAFLTPEKRKNDIAVDLPLTRDSIADYLGLTIETISRQFSALKKDGVIELQGARHVLVPDYDGLLMEAGDEVEQAF
ncbi:MAG: helix-turn-helix domain-containing protein [Pseudomonadota bacterium]